MQTFSVEASLHWRCSTSTSSYCVNLAMKLEGQQLCRKASCLNIRLNKKIRKRAAIFRHLGGFHNVLYGELRTYSTIAYLRRHGRLKMFLHSLGTTQAMSPQKPSS